MPKHLVRSKNNVLPKQVHKTNAPPILTRDEYHRLLTAAKEKGDERTYLLVKLFALTGLNVQELPQITVEAVAAGQFTVTAYGAKHTLRIPPALAKDLQSYATRQGITTGSIFLQRNGTPLKRFSAAYLIRTLAKDANVAPEKCNPRALRCLFQALKAEAEAQFKPMVEETLKRQLEEEQMTAGWNNA